MKNLEHYLNNIDFTELNKIERQIISGGDQFSEDVFYWLGVVFEYLERAAINGAPKGNTYKHSG